ncbi:hypothetical protein KI387_017184, partial [Taxus chinensis]
MEFFDKAMCVRLRSHHEKFLCAGEDEISVSQDRDGRNRNAIWQVEFIQGRPFVRLKSCFGRYLTATRIPFLLGWTGKKVQQSVPLNLRDSSVEWEPVKDGFHVLLRTHYGTYLRANGFTKPWKNRITHDIPQRTITQYWVFWEVQVTEIGTPLSPLPQSAPVVVPNNRGGRVIYYTVGDDKEGHDWCSFIFKGNDIYKLTIQLEKESGLHDITVCARHPFTGNLFPLAVEFPPNNAPLHLVLLPQSSSKGDLSPLHLEEEEDDDNDILT